MKKLFYFASLACMMMFAACSSDNDEIVEESQKGEMITVNVGMPGADTRVAFANNQITNMVWADKDQLTAVGYKGAWAKASKDVSIASEPGSATAKFSLLPIGSGQWENGAETMCNRYRFVYKGSKVSYVFNNPFGANSLGTADCKYLEQVQNKKEAGFEHIKDHLYMASDICDVVDNVIPFAQLAINNSVLKLNIPNLPTSIENAESYEVKFFVNYDENATEIAKLTFNGALEATDTLYLAFDPADDLAAGSNIGFEIVANNKTVKTKQLSANGKNYEAGKIYTVNTKDWTWEEEAAAPVLQEVKSFTFNKSTADWTFEGTGSNLFNNSGLYQECHAAGDLYAISPAFDLGKSSNQATFACSALSIWQLDKGELLVKKTSEKEWTSIATVSKGSIKTATAVTYDIPSKFDGQEVQFAFCMRAVDYMWSSWTVSYLNIMGVL